MVGGVISKLNSENYTIPRNFAFPEIYVWVISRESPEMKAAHLCWLVLGNGSSRLGEDAFHYKALKIQTVGYRILQQHFTLWSLIDQFLLIRCSVWNYITFNLFYVCAYFIWMWIILLYIHSKWINIFFLNFDWQLLHVHIIIYFSNLNQINLESILNGGEMSSSLKEKPSWFRSN